MKVGEDVEATYIDSLLSYKAKQRKRGWPVAGSIRTDCPGFVGNYRLLPEM